MEPEPYEGELPPALDDEELPLLLPPGERIVEGALPEPGLVTKPPEPVAGAEKPGTAPPPPPPPPPIDRPGAKLVPMPRFGPTMLELWGEKDDPEFPGDVP